MSFPSLLRSARTSLLMLLLLAVALLGLAMAEGTSSAPDRGGVTTPVFELSKNTKAEDAGSNGNHVKHCTDGKGSDAEKNKHCAGISQG